MGAVMKLSLWWAVTVELLLQGRESLGIECEDVDVGQM